MGGQEGMGWMVGVSGQPEADSIGPFGVAMSPRSANHRPRQAWRA